jgi:hypothetical protein
LDLKITCELLERNPMSILESLPRPATWLLEFWTNIVIARLPEMFQAFGWLLLIVGIIWGGIRIATLGSGEITGLMFRYMIAGFLVVAGPVLSKDARAAWIQAQSWGWTTFGEPKAKEAAQKMETLGIAGGSAALLAGGAVLAGAAAVGATGAAIGIEGVSAAGVMSGAVQAAPQAALSILDAGQAMLFLAVPIILAYYVVVIISGIGILVSSMFVPVAGALLIFPTGADWTIRWLKSMLTSLLTVALVPLIFATALQVGFIGPADQFNQKLGEVSQSIGSKWDKAGNDWNKGNFVGAALNAAGAAGQLTVGIFQMAIAFVWALLMIFLAMGAALAITNGGVNQIAQLIGGAMSSGAGAGAGAGVLAFGVSRALSGVSRGMSGAGPKTGSPNGPGSPDVKPNSPKGPGSPDGPKGTYDAATGKYTGSDRAAYDKAWSEARKSSGSTSGNYGKNSSMGSKTTDPPAEIRPASSKPDTFMGNSSKKAPKIG